MWPLDVLVPKSRIQGNMLHYVLMTQQATYALSKYVLCWLYETIG